MNVIKEIKKLDKNISNAVSRADGTLEIYQKKYSDVTKTNVIRYVNQKNLQWSFTKIDFHDIR